MTRLRHNGGPPLVDGEVPPLTYVKFYPADFLTGTMHLSLEERGAYITALCVMYDRMSGFPYDEKEGAALLRVDKRVYRRVRDDLIADGKFYRDGNIIRNRRVEDEIRDYISQYIRRSEAAKKRESERRQPQTSPELRPNLAPTSAGSTPEVRDKSAELEAKKPTITTERTPQPDHIPEARSQKPEARKEEREEKIAAPAPRTAALPRPDLDVLEAKLLEACNGALADPVNTSGLAILSTPLMWIDRGADLDLDIVPTLRGIGKREHGKGIRTWDYFTRAVAQAVANRKAGLPAVEPQAPKSTNTSVSAKLRAMNQRQNGGTNV